MASLHSFFHTCTCKVLFLVNFWKFCIYLFNSKYYSDENDVTLSVYFICLCCFLPSFHFYPPSQQYRNHSVSLFVKHFLQTQISLNHPINYIKTMYENQVLYLGVEEIRYFLPDTCKERSPIVKIFLMFKVQVEFGFLL